MIIVILIVILLMIANKSVINIFPFNCFKFPVDYDMVKLIQIL